MRPDAIVHAAAQPSHDLAASRPFDDFEVNAVGTLNLLEAARQWCPESPFVYTSTNKVYGDRPNELPLVELETRWDYTPEHFGGVDEDMSIDRTLHSIFGASKASADLLVQEYGRYFGIPTVCFRGGCLTGPQHAGVPLHGFLAYLARAVRDGLHYQVFGYKAKQVRDNLHSLDVCRAIVAFIERPQIAAVYNLGGGRDNSISMLEAIAGSKSCTAARLPGSTSTRLGSVITSVTSAIFTACAPTTRNGTSASRSMRSSTTSRA